MATQSLKALAATAALIVAVSGSASGQSLDLLDRRAADENARAAFLKLHFFADGRGMHMVPGLIEVFSYLEKTSLGRSRRDAMLSEKWGLNLTKHWPVGLFAEKYKGMNIGVLGCAVCHTGRAAGRFIVGLGNKNIDVLKMGEDTNWVESVYKKINPFQRDDPDYREVRDGALEFARRLSNERVGNTTQGMVPVSFIRTWFYKQAGEDLPTDMTPGAVKVPSLWGYGAKRQVGQFSDGFGNGLFSGWAVAVELTAGQRPETIRSYLPRVEEAEEILGNFLPPRYPYPVNDVAASRGKNIFENTCARCHGTYETDEGGFPLYKAPRFVPIEVVNTDRDRLTGNTRHFRDLVATSPMNDIIKATPLGNGYFSPRLVGIWSRFPYLHNGSVPNIAALLTLPEKRPRIFSLRHAGEAERFDETSLGLTTLKGSAFRSKGARDVYDTSTLGHSNLGHPFGTSLSDADKTNLIEYLKTL